MFQLRVTNSYLLFFTHRPAHLLSTGYHQACKEFGFFYLENHGIPEEVVEQVFQASKAFFSLDQDDKLSVKADKNNRGYTPMHEEVLDPENQTKGDTKVRIWHLPLLLLDRSTAAARFVFDGGGGRFCLQW